MTIAYCEGYTSQVESCSSRSSLEISDDDENSSSASSSGSDAPISSTIDGEAPNTSSIADEAHKSQPEVVYLYESEKVRELFKGLKLAQFNLLPSSKYEDDTSSSPSITLPVSKSRLTVSSAMACSVCSVTFSCREHQLHHFRSQQHCSNVARESRQVSVCAQEEAVSVTDEDRKLSLSRHSRLFLTNASRQIFSVYKCLLFGKRSDVGQSQIELAVKQLPRQLNVAVFLISGGRFAAAIFSGGDMLVHKTFHSYTVRAGQGTCQATRDRRDGHRCKSAGASLRRYNLASFTQRIRELLASWQQQLASCRLIFVRAVRGSAGAAAMFARGSDHVGAPAGSVLSRKDERLRTVPFATRRPSHSQLQYVYKQLMTLYVYGTDVDIDLNQLPDSPSKRRPLRSIPRPAPNPCTPCHPSRVPTSGHPGTSLNATPQLSSVSEAVQHEEEDVEEDDSAQDSEIKIKYMSSVLDLTDCGLDGLSNDCRDWEDIDLPATTPSRRTPRSSKGCARDHCHDHHQQLHQKEEVTSEDQTIVQKGGASESSESSEAVKDLSPELKDVLVICYTLCREGNTERLLDKLTALSNSSANQESSFCDVTLASSSDWLSNSAQLASLRADWRIARLMRAKLGSHERTLLHTAATFGHGDVVRLLLEVGSDPTCRDKQGRTGCDLSADRTVRNVFRRYRAAHPGQHDYAKAHIPAPLTDEMDSERSARASQRRLQQKERRRLLAKQKLAQQAEENRLAEEARIQCEERLRFLALSDREKMALAAERRISQQVATDTGKRVVLSRCFCCGTDITGKVPFTYSELIFCSTVCVRHHRAEKQK